MWNLLRTVLLSGGVAPNEAEADQRSVATSLRDKITTYFADSAGIQIHNFWEQFQDGSLFSQIVGHLAPAALSSVGSEEGEESEESEVSLEPMSTEEKMARSFAKLEESFGVPSMLSPSDFAKGKRADERSVVNYLTLLLSVAEAKRQGQQIQQELSRENEARKQQHAREQELMHERVSELNALREKEAATAAQREVDARRFIEQQEKLKMEMEIELARIDNEKEQLVLRLVDERAAAFSSVQDKQELQQAHEALVASHLTALSELKELQTHCETKAKTITNLDAAYAMTQEALLSSEGEVARLRKELANALDTVATEREANRALQKKTSELSHRAKSLTSSLWTLHKEHEEVLERISGERRSIYEAEKRANPHSETTGRLRTMQERISMAITSATAEEDFVKGLPDFSGYLLRRKPKAVFKERNFKKTFFRLRGLKLTCYSTEDPSTKKGKSIQLTQYVGADYTSTTPGQKTFKLVAKNPKQTKAIMFEFKSCPRSLADSKPKQKGRDRSSSAGNSQRDERPKFQLTKKRNTNIPTEATDGSDADVAVWLHELNRRIALANYLEELRENKTQSCKELLDFICNNSATAFVLEDRITGFEKALTALSPALMHRPNLEMICLRNCSLGAPSVKLISDILKHNTTVKHLDLCNNLICPAACVHLHEALNINSSLLSLNLDNNQIGDKGLGLIGKSLPHSELRFLSLVGNGIGDTGTHGLVQGLLASADRNGHAHKFPAFKLRENLVTNCGAKAIADLVARSGETQVIDLEKNLVTDEGAIAIAEAISSEKSDLARVLLGGNNLSEKGVQAIHAALPRTEREVVVDFSDNKLVSRKAFMGLVNDLNMQFDFVKFKIKKAGVQVNDFERGLHSHISLAVEKSARSLSGASLCVNVPTRSGEPLSILDKSDTEEAEKSTPIIEPSIEEAEKVDCITANLEVPSSPVAA